MPQVERGAGDQGLDPSALCNERPFSVTADGCQKVNHYANCGKTMTGIIQPQLRKYFGACNEAAQTVQSRAVSQDDHSTCAASLACAREVANKGGGVTDIKCLITCTCLHTVPSKGCFIAARTNEQLLFYNLMLSRLMPERMPASLVENVCEDTGALPHDTLPQVQDAGAVLTNVWVCAACLCTLRYGGSRGCLCRCRSCK